MVRTMASGERSYVVWVKVRGTGIRPQCTIGKVGEIDFNDALEKAQAAIAMARRGEDYSTMFIRKHASSTHLVGASLGAATSTATRPVSLNHLQDLYIRSGCPSMKRGGGVKQTVRSAATWTVTAPTFADGLIGKARLRDIDDALVSRWRRSIEKIEVSRDGHRRITNAGAVGHAVTQLKSLLSWGRRVHKLEVGEVVEHVAPKAKRRQGFYDFPELKVLRAAIDERIAFYRAAGKFSQVRGFVAIGLFIETGARPGEEVFSWRWQWLRNSKEFGAHVMLPRDKTNPEPIPLLMSDRAVALLAHLPHGAGDDFVFPSPKAKCGRLTTVQDLWAELMALPAVRNASLKQYPPYTLRHSLKTGFDELGIPPAVTRIVMRHAAPDIHSGYGHATAGAAHRALEKYSDAIERVSAVRSFCKKSEKGDTTRAFDSDCHRPAGGHRLDASHVRCSKRGA